MMISFRDKGIAGSKATGGVRCMDGCVTQTERCGWLTLKVGWVLRILVSTEDDGVHVCLGLSLRGRPLIVKDLTGSYCMTHTMSSTACSTAYIEAPRS